MDIYEEMVMTFLVANKETFIVPQYPIGQGWSYPDFLAIRPAKKHAYIVEVSSAWNLETLLKKVRSRDTQWLTNLANQLKSLCITEETWVYRVLIFVRRERIEWFRKGIGDSRDVLVIPLEITFTPWNWKDIVYTSDFSFERDAFEK